MCILDLVVLVQFCLEQQLLTNLTPFITDRVLFNSSARFKVADISGLRSKRSREGYIKFLDCLVKLVVVYKLYMENRLMEALKKPEIYFTCCRFANN